MSLAVADLVVGVFVMPISAIYVLTGKKTNNSLPKRQLSHRKNERKKIKEKNSLYKYALFPEVIRYRSGCLCGIRLRLERGCDHIGRIADKVYEKTIKDELIQLEDYIYIYLLTVSCYF